MADALAGFTRTSFEAEGKARDLYRAGDGPAVIVIHEMPGITPEVAAFGRRVAGGGCTAVLPHLFGDPGRPLAALYGLRTMAWGCISREFASFALGRTSPVVTWLRALATAEHERCGGPGVGVVGMCFTGGFALGMMVDETVVAPALSQPSLPFAIGARRKRAVGVSDADLARVVDRCARGTEVLGLRFTADPFVPAERFATLRRALGDRFRAVEIESSSGNPHGIKRRAHSVVTNDLVDEPGHPTRVALDELLQFFRERLVGPEA